jgi:hypothetical protein
MMQLKLDREIHFTEILAHFQSLLKPNHTYHTVPVAETLVKRFSVSIQGSLFGFSTTTTRNGTPSITVGAVLTILVALFSESCCQMIDHWTQIVKNRRREWKRFATHQPPAGMARHERKAEKARRKRDVVAGKAMLNMCKEWLLAWKELAERCNT